VTWSSSRGGAGFCGGTESWCVGDLVLAEGTNVITATAHDASGKTSSTSLTVVYRIPDSNFNGIPDSWEILRFGNLTTATANSDYDHDGCPDIYEYRAGTDPTNNASYFGMTGISVTPTASVVVKWKTGTNNQYRLERTTNLISGFLPYRYFIDANLSTTSYVDTVPASNGRVFYRLQLQ
jgi:hypothetical protein